MAGKNPYLTAQNALETPRQLEYRLFSSVTRALIDVRPLMNSGHPSDVAKIASAIGWNRDVWNHLMFDQPAKGLRGRPGRRDQEGPRRPGRCRRGLGKRDPAVPAGPSAAQHPGAVDRQPAAEHPAQPVPLIGSLIRYPGKGARKAPFSFASSLAPLGSQHPAGQEQRVGR